MLCVYKFNFFKSSLDLNDDYERLSDIDKEKINDMETFSYIEYEEDKKYAIFIIAEPTEVKKYTNILDENLIPYQYKNISEDVLKNKINVEYHISGSLSPFRMELFIDDLNEWIYNNLDIDTILDRISSVGIKSLTVIEQKFLKNYNL